MRAVIDTNVLLVANGRHEGVSPDCVSECVRRLQAMQQSGVTVIDDGFQILGEYGNETRPNSPKGVGDVFLKWLLQNQCNETRVEQVSLTGTGEDLFADCPSFDLSDRKFVAVAHAHPEKPPIWQAADCKWLDWWPALKAKDVIVEFLCRDDVCQFYHKKFPRKPEPALPGANTP
jgi:hypothetical protein